MLKMISRLFVFLLLPHLSHAHTIYNANHLERLQEPFNSPVYVQMGSFSHANAASNYQRKLRAETHQNVMIRPNQGRYQVLIGPFYDVQALRKVAPIIQSAQTKHSTTEYTPWTASLKAVSPITPKNNKRTPVLNKESQTYPISQDKWYLNAQVGGQSPQANRSTTVNNGSGYAPPNDQDIYTNEAQNQSVVIGFQAGRRFALTDEPWLTGLSVGLQYQYFFSSNLNGKIEQFSLPQFTNYNFTLQNATQLVLAHAKVNFIDYRHFSPYFNVGIGSAYHQQDGYTEKAIPDVTPRISPNFQSNSNAEFAYIFGIGIDYTYTDALIFSVGYQYSQLGNINAGRGTGDWANQRLSFGSELSNAYLFGMTYLFDLEIPTFKSIL